VYDVSQSTARRPPADVLLPRTLVDITPHLFPTTSACNWPFGAVLVTRLDFGAR